MKRVMSGFLFAIMLASYCQAADAIKINVKSGPHPAGPVYWKPDKPLEKDRQYALKEKGGKILPAQLDAEGRLWWWTDASPAKSETDYEVVPALTKSAVAHVQVGPEKEGIIEITIDGKPFTAFNFKKNEVKPYLYPVIGPTGDAVTRNFPMKDTEEERNKKPTGQDHPHHRSLWTAHGDVRTTDLTKFGTNYWAEGEDTGLEKVKKIVRTVSGPVFGEIEAEIDWCRRDGVRELSETRTYTFFCGNAQNRMIDVTVALHFSDGDVTFQDTKESGMLSLRVASWLDELAGGHMTNSEGQKGMKECWGKPATWCDYVGKHNDQTIGIAVLDSKTNFRHPSRWHIRDYGLYTANPFAEMSFTQNPNVTGTKTWKKGENETFHYRVLIHEGDTEPAHIREQYQLYTEPLEVSVKK